MHGLIVSDAFGVPNRRLCLSQGIISDYKFIDYYSAFDLDEPAPLYPQMLDRLVDFEPAELVGECVRPGLTQLQEGLLKAFPLI
jgi:hypothetical protein